MKSVFECTCCGYCCEGKGGIVVSSTDLERLCAHMSCTPKEFLDRYGEMRNNKLHIKTGSDNHCLFFMQGSGCVIHDFKPDICRAWPFFRGNLIDEASLELAKGLCPGIAKQASLEEFAQQGIAYLHEHNLIGSKNNKSARALLVDDLCTANQDSTTP